MNEEQIIDVSGNDSQVNEAPIVVYAEPDFSGIESEISDLHYQQSEIIEILQEYQEAPRVTPTILFSVTFVFITFLFLFRR